MIICKCIEKFRDKQGRIYGYKLIDANNQIKDMTSNALKKAINNNQIQVENLKLTSDGRLVDRKVTNKGFLRDLGSKSIKSREVATACANRIASIVNNTASKCVDYNESENELIMWFDIGKVIYNGDDRCKLCVCINTELKRLTLSLDIVDECTTLNYSNISLTENIQEDLFAIERFTDIYGNHIKRLNNF